MCVLQFLVALTFFVVFVFPGQSMSIHGDAALFDFRNREKARRLSSWVDINS